MRYTGLTVSLTDSLAAVANLLIITERTNQYLQKCLSSFQWQSWRLSLKLLKLTISFKKMKHYQKHPSILSPLSLKLSDLHPVEDTIVVTTNFVEVVVEEGGQGDHLSLSIKRFTHLPTSSISSACKN